MFISHSADETVALGDEWGRAAFAGLVIGVTGDLGAGKTQLAKGVAHGLGIPARVHSPTFTLVNEYSGGRLPLFHIDLYRLETPEQITAAELEEYLHSRGVAIIEWAERWPGLGTLRARALENFKFIYRRARIEIISETERHITYEDSGT